jgi:hypothetical protein
VQHSQLPLKQERRTWRGTPSGFRVCTARLSRLRGYLNRYARRKTGATAHRPVIRWQVFTRMFPTGQQRCHARRAGGSEGRPLPRASQRAGQSHRRADGSRPHSDACRCDTCADADRRARRGGCEGVHIRRTRLRRPRPYVERRIRSIMRSAALCGVTPAEGWFSAGSVTRCCA